MLWFKMILSVFLLAIVLTPIALSAQLLSDEVGSLPVDVAPEKVALLVALASSIEHVFIPPDSGIQQELLDLPVPFSPFALATPAPKPPIDPNVVRSIAAASYGATGLIQLSLVNGQTVKGKVRMVTPASFVFRSRGSSVDRTICFEEVSSTTPLKPDVKEALTVGLEFAGLGALIAVSVPFMILMGIGCNFHCS